MFVQYYGIVERPFPEVERQLLDLGDSLAGPADSAYRLGEGLVVKIGGSGVAKSVMLDLKTPLLGAGIATVPLEWWATGTAGLFPRMEAELTAADLGGALTQVRFQGSYQPPLGPVGRVLDRTVFGRFAEASVKDFVDRVIAILAG